MARKKIEKKLNPVKDPYIVETFTRRQRKALKIAVVDPIFFIKKYVKIVHPLKGIMRFKPYPFQIEMLETFHKHRFTIVMTARQMGKTSIVAAYLLWKSIFEDNFTILLAAHKQKGSIEILGRVKQMYESLPAWIKPGVLAYNKTSINFDNGSRIIAEATTESTGRGLSISLLYLDEFAFVDPPSVAEEFWTSIRPTLATGGSAIITSTPNSDEDQYARIWSEANNLYDENGEELGNGEGRNGFKPLKYTWDKHPDRDEKWARTEERAVGMTKFKREHNCVVGNTKVMIKASNGSVKCLSIEELYQILKNNK